jgi:hypothetical protein
MVVDSLLRRQVAVVGRNRSRDKIDHRMQGSLLPARPRVVGHGHNGEVAEEGDRPCAVEVCRKHLAHILREAGNPWDVRSLDVQGVGSKDHSEDEEAVCASD